jgi:multicomponent Na+:H+ antiporter subunit D
MQTGVVEYHLAGWAPPVGIAYRVDHLNGLVLVAVAAVAFINLLGTRPLVVEAFGDRLGPFYTLYILLVTGLMGMVVTGDAFNLYVLLEIAALTGYALVGMGEGRAPLSSLNYIFIGTLGASFYLLGRRLSISCNRHAEHGRLGRAVAGTLPPKWWCQPS